MFDAFSLMTDLIRRADKGIILIDKKSGYHIGDFSPYLGWDFSDPETAVVRAAFHAFEWLFVRIAPFVLIGTIAGIYLTRKKM